MLKSVNSTPVDAGKYSTVFSAQALDLIRLRNRLGHNVNRLNARNNSTPLNLLNHQGSRTDRSLALPD